MGSSSIEKSSDPNVINKHSIQHRKETDKTIFEFIMPSRIIVDVFHFAYYKEVAKKIIASGPEYLSPTYNELEFQLTVSMEGPIKDLKKTWVSTRCNIIMNEWIFTHVKIYQEQ